MCPRAGLQGQTLAHAEACGISEAQLLAAAREDPELRELLQRQPGAGAPLPSMGDAQWDGVPEKRRPGGGGSGNGSNGGGGVVEVVMT